jgi:hypothetical protein
VQEALYEKGAGRQASTYFHDIVKGDNSFPFEKADGSVATITGAVAKPGWDAATGLGTPVGSKLVRLLGGGDGGHDGHGGDDHRGR